MNSTAILILVIVGMLAGGYFGSRYNFMRATRQIMQLFSHANAFDMQSAVKADEVGLIGRPFYMRWGMRDYKVMAFQSLVQANVIKTLETEEGSKYYISRENCNEVLSKI